MKPKYILGIGIIIIFILYAGFSFRKGLTPYVSFEEAKKSNYTVQVIGDILHQETFYEIETQKLHFTLEDKNENKLQIEYGGTSPGNFEQAKTAVVIGKYDKDKQVFVAEKVLVKCPSKYQGQVE